MTETALPSAEQQYWENFYQERGPVWSGRPNPLLVREVAALPPGSALDLGCGEGADAIWLAERGWRVTAVDISATALRRAAERAVEAGVHAGITWARHDLSRSFPAGSFDLVSAQFLHSPVTATEDRDMILRRAADAVAPDGVLLIVGHAGWPSWVDEPPFDYRFSTTRDVLDALHLAQDRWRVEVEDVIDHAMTGPDGQPGRRSDIALRVRRLP